MDVPFPLEPGFSQGSSRAIARLAVLSVTLRAAGTDEAFQLARIMPDSCAAGRGDARSGPKDLFQRIIGNDCQLGNPIVGAQVICSQGLTTRFSAENEVYN